MQKEVTSLTLQQGYWLCLVMSGCGAVSSGTISGWATSCFIKSGTFGNFWECSQRSNGQSGGHIMYVQHARVMSGSSVLGFRSTIYGTAGLTAPGTWIRILYFQL